MNCKNCNTPLGEEARFCPNCGESVSLDAPEKTKGRNAHLRYRNDFQKQSILQLAMQILSICLIAAMLFAPIYAISAGDGYEELPSINFSAYDDLVLVIDDIMDMIKGESDDYFGLMVNLFLLLEFIFAVITIISMIPRLKNLIGEIMDPDTASLLRYNEIRKSGGEKKKEGIFKKQMILSAVLYAGFDVVYVKIFATLLGSGTGRYMNYVDSVSGMVVIPAIILVAYFAASYIASGIDKKIKISIFKEDM